MRGQLGKPVQNGRSGGFARTGRVIQFVGGQVAEVFQQGGAPRGEPDGVKMQRALHGLKLLFGPHLAVLFHPRGTLGVPHLHGGEVIAGKSCFQHQRFGVFAFSAGRAAQHQRQHWGVYGVMPPSAKE